LSAFLLSSNLFLLAVPKIIKKVVILETVFSNPIAHRQWSHRPEKLILFSCKKSRQGKFKKDNQRIAFLVGRASLSPHAQIRFGFRRKIAPDLLIDVSSAGVLYMFAI
jgi:hypothetical protein